MKNLSFLFLVCFSFINAQEIVTRRIGEQGGYALYEKSTVSEKQDTLKISQPGYSRTEIRFIKESVVEDTIQLSLQAEKAMSRVNWWWLKDVLTTGREELRVEDGVTVERPWQGLGFRKIITEKHRELYLSSAGKVELTEYSLSSEKISGTFVGYVVFFSLIWCLVFICEKISRVGWYGYIFLFLVGFVFIHFLDFGSGIVLLWLYLIFVIAEALKDNEQGNLVFTFLFVQVIFFLLVGLAGLGYIELLLVLVGNLYSSAIGYLLYWAFKTVFPKYEKPRLTDAVSV